MIKRRNFLLATCLSLVIGFPLAGQADDVKYGLQEGKPYAGTKLSILSVVTPQFDGLMLRDDEFTKMTGIETEWTFIPFGSLQGLLRNNPV